MTAEQLDRLDRLYRTSSYRNRLLGSKANQRRRAGEVRAIRAKARVAVAQLRHNELWLAGLMLYWAEGNKTQQVGVANSDPRLVRFMMKWFREICHVPEGRFKAYLNIHSGQDDEWIKAFWADVTGLPLVQFGKSYVKREGTGHRKNILYRGTVKIQICNRNLLHTIHGWIEGFCEHEFGPLAHLVEQLSLKQRVTGSIPVRPTSFTAPVQEDGMISDGHAVYGYPTDRRRGQRASGETGRRAGLRSLSRKGWRFNSSLAQRQRGAGLRPPHDVKAVTSGERVARG